mmetsp:Transcript_43886/g.104313  ORF Transcript_43886/g.104313 Transcript_43886/m.104313 type:complete len:203 (-) Transcript_43886:1571-2179(-)
MLRGKAERMRLRSWMQEGGIASHSARWYSQRNSGKSWRRTSSTRSVPLYSSFTGSWSSAVRRKGSMYLKSPTSILWKGTHPFDRFAWRRRGMRERCEASSSHAKAKPGRRRGCTAISTSANENTTASETTSVRSRRRRSNMRWNGFWLNAAWRSVCMECMYLTMHARNLFTMAILVIEVERAHSSWYRSSIAMSLLTASMNT